MKKFKFIQKSSKDKVRHASFLRALHADLKNQGTDAELVALIKKHTELFKKAK